MQACRGRFCIRGSLTHLRALLLLRASRGFSTDASRTASKWHPPTRLRLHATKSLLKICRSFKNILENAYFGGETDVAWHGVDGVVWRTCGEERERERERERDRKSEWRKEGMDRRGNTHRDSCPDSPSIQMSRLLRERYVCETHELLERERAGGVKGGNDDRIETTNNNNHPDEIRGETEGERVSTKSYD